MSSKTWRSAATQRLSTSGARSWSPWRATATLLGIAALLVAGSATSAVAAVAAAAAAASGAASAAATHVGSVQVRPIPFTSSAGWVIQTTPSDGLGAQLNAVRCTVATNCIAVGYYEASGTFKAFAEQWNGSTWSVKLPPSAGSESQLWGISCTSSTFCMAVGWYQNIHVVNVTLTEKWDGSHWTSIGPPNPSGATETQLNAISCVASNACTAVGFYRNSAGTIFTFAEGWNGSSWHIEGTPNPTGATLSQLLGISCKSASTCMAVGNYTTGSNHEVPLSETLSGSTWSIRGAATASGERAGSLTGVACVSSTNCFAVGDFVPSTSSQTTLAEHWDGGAWTIKSTPGVKGSQQSSLDAVSCVSGSDCTAVGFYVNSHNESLTTAEAWNGTSWQQQTTPSPSGALESHLSDVSCAAVTFCTAVGNQLTSHDQDLPLAEQWVLDITTSTTVTSSNKTAVTGQPITLTATVKPSETGFGSPTGTVTFTVKSSKGTSISCSSGNTVGVSSGVAHCSIPSGKLLPSQTPYSVSVKYNGAADFKASTATLSPSISVGKDGTSVTVTSSANPVVYSQVFTMTATIKASSPGSGTPTGTVTFTVDGQSKCNGSSTATINSKGQATCGISSFLAIGKHTILATYNGDSNYSGSSNSKSPFTETVNKDGTTITLTSSANPTVYTQQPYSITATVAAKAPGRAVPTGAVTFSVVGQQFGVCDDGNQTFTLNSKGQAVCTVQTSLNPGTYPFVGSYPGDTNFNGVTNAPSPYKEVVKKADTTTVLSGPSNAFAGGSDQYTAVVTPNSPADTRGVPMGNVTFTAALNGGGKPFALLCNSTQSNVVAISQNPNTARWEADCNAGFATAGTYTITATYDGETGYNTSSKTHQVTVTVIG